MSLIQEKNTVSDLAATGFFEPLNLPDIALSGIEDIPTEDAVTNDSMPQLNLRLLSSAEYVHQTLCSQSY